MDSKRSKILKNRQKDKIFPILKNTNRKYFSKHRIISKPESIRADQTFQDNTRSIFRSNNPWCSIIAPLSPNLNLTRPHRSHWQWISGVKWNRLRFRKREFLNLIVINIAQQPDSDRFKIGAEGNKNIPRKRSFGTPSLPQSPRIVPPRLEWK